MAPTATPALTDLTAIGSAPADEAGASTLSLRRILAEEIVDVVFRIGGVNLIEQVERARLRRENAIGFGELFLGPHEDSRRRVNEGAAGDIAVVEGEKAAAAAMRFADPQA